jgi:Flp pilus assembly protein TadG
MSPSARDEAGQSSVELALSLPVLAFLALLLLQVGFLVRDQVLVTHAAREAVRQAAVDADPEAATDAARHSSRLDAERLVVVVTERGEAGGRVRVRVQYQAPTDVPLVGALVGRIRLRAAATMRVEQ